MDKYKVRFSKIIDKKTVFYFPNKKETLSFIKASLKRFPYATADFFIKNKENKIWQLISTFKYEIASKTQKWRLFEVRHSHSIEKNENPKKPRKNYRYRNYPLIMKTIDNLNKFSTSLCDDRGEIYRSKISQKSIEKRFKEIKQIIEEYFTYKNKNQVEK